MFRRTRFFLLGSAFGVIGGLFAAGATMTLLSEEDYNDLLLHIYKNRSQIDA